VDHCTEEDEDDCPEYDLSVLVDPASAEAAITAKSVEKEVPLESRWVSYYTNAGSFDASAKLLHDPQEGWVTEPTQWRAPQAGGRESRIWMVVRDNRAGVSWTWRDVYVR
jgi:hypothetical protein